MKILGRNQLLSNIITKYNTEMKKGTKIFLVSLVVEIVAETISDTRKEYLDHIEKLEDAYMKLKALKEKEIGGDVYESARLDYIIIHKKVEKDMRLFWKLVPKSKRQRVIDMDVCVREHTFKK